MSRLRAQRRDTIERKRSDVWLEDGEEDAPDDEPIDEPADAPQQPYVPNDWPFERKEA